MKEKVQGLCSTGTVLTSKHEANSLKAVNPTKGKVRAMFPIIEQLKCVDLLRTTTIKTQAARMKCMVEKSKKGFENDLSNYSKDSNTSKSPKT